MRFFKHATSVGLGLVFSLAAASSASADRYELGIGGGTHFVPMESMDSVSEKRGFGVVSLHAGVKLPELPLLDGFQSELVLNWDFGELGGTTFNRIDTDLEVDAIVASGRLRRELWGPISAFGDAGLGVQWASLRLSDNLSSASRPLTGDAKSMLSSLGGGADVRVVDTPIVRMALRVQANYVAATSMHFDATPMSAGEDVLEIDTRSSDLGSINTTGLVLKAGFFGSF
jgi:hypothetical protein